MTEGTKVKVEAGGETAFEGSAEEFEEAVDAAVQDSADDRRLERDDLPPDLRPAFERLRAATDSHNPVPSMPEGRNYPPAEQVAAIADVLIEELPTHAPLSSFKIECVYRGSLTVDGEPALGKMTKCGRKWRELGGFDFLLEVNLEPYCFLSRAERIRLVDHELCHATADPDDPDAPAARGHDIEEFVEIVDRWGTWHRKPAIRQLIEKGQQTDLFETR